MQLTIICLQIREIVNRVRLATTFATYTNKCELVVEQNSFGISNAFQRRNNDTFNIQENLHKKT